MKINRVPEIENDHFDLDHFDHDCKKRQSVKLTEEIADYVQNVCCIGQILLILSSKKVKLVIIMRSIVLSQRKERDGLLEKVFLPRDYQMEACHTVPGTL